MTSFGDTNIVFSLEGPIGVGKSTVLKALEKKGYKIYPEPTHLWENELECFYKSQKDGDTKDSTRAALNLQYKVIETLDDRYAEIDSINFYDRPVIVERSMLAGWHIFVEINHKLHPHPSEWMAISKSYLDSCKMYEENLTRISLHHDNVETLIARTKNREGVDEDADEDYLRKVYDESLQFENENCDYVVNVTNKGVEEIANEIEVHMKDAIGF